MATEYLVLGTPRSGTTLLTCLIGAHPECISMSECFSMEQGKIVSPTNNILNKLCTPNHIQYRYSAKKNLASKAVQRLKDKMIRYITLKLKKEFIHIPRVDTSIEKYMKNNDKRKLIIIIRKPDDVISSMMKRDNLSKKHAVSRWAYGLDQLCLSVTEHTERCVAVKFEQLVKEPVKELKRVCEFMNIEYDKKMKSGAKQTPQYSHDKIEKNVLSRRYKVRIDQLPKRHYNLYQHLVETYT
jgi:hypothetical protein